MQEVDKEKLKKYLQEILKHNVSLERDTRGHSSALNYIVIGDKEKYYVKIYTGNREKGISMIQDIYQRLAIPTAKVIHKQYKKSIDGTIVIYEYIEGCTLYELTKILEIEQLEQIGIKIGKEIKKFEKVKIDNKNYIKDFNEEIKQLTIQAINIKDRYEKECGKLPAIDLTKLINKFNNLKKYILEDKPIFIHNDINYNNIIIKGDLPYFIDTDGGKIKFRALDFRGICWWGWSGDNKEKERSIYRGIFDGIFDYQIPIEFHKQIEFTIIYEFLLRLSNYKDDNEEVRYGFEKFKPIFEECNYFEDCKFKWL